MLYVLIYTAASLIYGGFAAYVRTLCGAGARRGPQVVDIYIHMCIYIYICIYIYTYI